MNVKMKAVLKVNLHVMMAVAYQDHGNVMSTGVIVVTVKTKPIVDQLVVITVKLEQ